MCRGRICLPLALFRTYYEFSKACSGKPVSSESPPLHHPLTWAFYFVTVVSRRCIFQPPSFLFFILVTIHRLLLWFDSLDLASIRIWVHTELRPRPSALVPLALDASGCGRKLQPFDSGPGNNMTPPGDNALGPQYNDQDDFTLTFEHLVLTIIPVSLFILCSPWVFFRYLRNHREPEDRDSGLLLVLRLVRTTPDDLPPSPLWAF